jgi:hypothetical protein
MKNLILAGAFFSALFVTATPASAQYRFDRRIDPAMCRWTEICDYGGRAYVHRIYKVRWSRRSLCGPAVIERRLPDGRIVVEKTRRCAISVKG